VWVCNDAVVVKSRVFCHIEAIIAYQGKGIFRLYVVRGTQFKSPSDYT
jgi:hypothetical protein